MKPHMKKATKKEMKKLIKNKERVLKLKSYNK